MSSERSGLAEVLLLTDAEWRAFQQIPDQGYSHRAWIDERILRRHAALLAHLADVLGSDETREVVFKACTPFGYKTDGSLPLMYERSKAQIADAALAAVREVLGLPGGEGSEDGRNEPVSDRARSAVSSTVPTIGSSVSAMPSPYAQSTGERVVDEVPGEWDGSRPFCGARMSWDRDGSSEICTLTAGHARTDHANSTMLWSE